MKQGAKLAAAIAAVTVAAFSWSAATADTIVLGGGQAEACSKAARAAADADDPSKPKQRLASPQESIALCDLAINHDVLNQRDLAATYVNRGVLHLGAGDIPMAQFDFENAVLIRPDLAEGHANRGAVLIMQNKMEQGIAELDRAIALKTEQLEKSYYNRAIARERLNDTRGAYEDFRMAVQIMPTWTPAQVELARFTVTQK